MPFTSQLGVADSVLGKTQQLAGATGTLPTGDQEVSTSNALGFVAQEAIYDPVINRLAANTMLSDSAVALYRAVSQSLFTASTATPDAFVDASNFLGFTDRKTFDIGNILFSKLSVPAPVRVQEAVLAIANNLMFVNPDLDNVVIQAHTATNTFGFIDVISTSTFVAASNTFTLADVIVSTGTTERAPANSGFLRQSLSFSIGGPNTDNCREKEFAPLIGESDDESFAAFLTTPPTIVPTTEGITLTFPRVSPTSTLNLEIPNFGNTDTWNLTRIDRVTRGNDRKIFSDPKWAKFERLIFTLDGNNENCSAGIDEIIAFLNVSLMKEIGFTDWEGRTWSGFILAADTDIIATPEGFSLQLVFEGELTTLEVQHGESNVILGQDGNGDDIEVILTI